MREALYYRVALLLSSMLLIVLCLGIMTVSNQRGLPTFEGAENRDRVFAVSGPGLGWSPDLPAGEPERPDTGQGDFERFLASAYSLNGRTFSGVAVNTGIVAADPEVLPIGSVVEIRAGRYSGIYSVLDIGSSIKGKRIDIYIPSNREARQFGRRPVQIRVIRHGWDPALPADG